MCSSYLLLCLYNNLMLDANRTNPALNTRSEVESLAELSLCSRLPQNSRIRISSEHSETSILEQSAHGQGIQQQAAKNTEFQDMSEISMIVTGGIQYARYLSQQETLIDGLLSQYQSNLATLTHQTEQLLQHSQLDLLACDRLQLTHQIRDLSAKVSSFKKISSCQTPSKKNIRSLNPQGANQNKVLRELTDQLKFQKRLFNKQQLHLQDLEAQLNKIRTRKKRSEMQPSNNIQLVKDSPTKQPRKGSTLRKNSNEYHSLSKGNNYVKEQLKTMETENQYGLLPFTCRKTHSKYSVEEEPEAARKELLFKRRELLKASLALSADMLTKKEKQLAQENAYLADELLCIDQQINLSDIQQEGKMECSPSTEAEFKPNKSEPHLLKCRSENLKSIAENKGRRILKVASPLLRQNSVSRGKLRIRSAYEIEENVYERAKPPRSISRESGAALRGAGRTSRIKNEKEVMKEYFQVRTRSREKPMHPFAS